MTSLRHQQTNPTQETLKSVFFVFQYSLKSLRRHLRYSLVVLAIFALGIGINAIIFSFVYAVLLHPLQYPNAKQLVAIPAMARTGGSETSLPDYHDLRDGNHTFDALIAYHDDLWPLTAPGEQATSLHVGIVSASTFSMLGVKPLRGRTFTAQEDEDIAGPMSVLISEQIWQDHYSSDPNIIGRSIMLRGFQYTIIGVMPAGFQFPIIPDRIDAWTTWGYTDYLRSPLPWPRERGTRFLNLAGILKPQITPQQASNDLATISDQLAVKYPASNQYHTVRVEPMLAFLTHQQRTTLLLLQAAGGCLLLIVLANITNVTLAHASRLRRARMICIALGAKRSQVFWQILCESEILAIAGGALGLGIATLTTRFIIHLSPVSLPRIGDVHISLLVVALLTLIASVSGIIVGLIPALRVFYSHPTEILQETSQGAGDSTRKVRTRDALIVAQVATTLILISGASLLVTSLFNLTRFNPGFDAHNVMTAQLTFPVAQYSSDSFNQALDNLEVQLRSVPGIASIGDVTVLPLGGDTMQTRFEIEGHPLPRAEQPRIHSNVIGPGYTETMHIPLLSGRTFSNTDTAQSLSVVLIDQTLANRYFPNQDPVGRRIRPGIAAFGSTERPFRTIVGVVGTVAESSIGQESTPEIYIPRSQLPFHYATIVVRTNGTVGDEMSNIIKTLHKIAPDIPLDKIRALSELVSASEAQTRFLTILLVVFAALSLILIAVGMYGVISYLVLLRTREIAMRKALGAQIEDLLRAVLGREFILISLGVLIGVIGTVLMSQLLHAVVYQVSPTNPALLSLAAFMVLIVSTFSMLVPAWSAIKMNPITGLRTE
jgi:predicted permease